MPILWTLLLILCAGLSLALGLTCAEQFRSGIVTRSRSFWCAARHQDVTVEFAETAQDARRLAVCSCSAFAPPTAVACDKACLTLARFPDLHRAPVA